jgi:hypothetical protein
VAKIELATRDPFHHTSRLALACRTCGGTLDLGLIHRDDRDMEQIALARRIKREAPEKLDAVADFIGAHRDHDWSPVALMPAQAYNERTKD